MSKAKTPKEARWRAEAYHAQKYRCANRYTRAWIKFCRRCANRASRRFGSMLARSMLERYWWRLE